MKMYSPRYEEAIDEILVYNSENAIYERNNYAQPQNIDELQCYSQPDTNDGGTINGKAIMDVADAADQLLAAEEACHMSIKQAEEVLADQRTTELEKEQADEILALADVSGLDDMKAEKILATKQSSRSN